ncbi:MAG: response regulator [Bacteroidales bacterium]
MSSILIIDPDENFLHEATDYLRQSGYTVISAKNGATGVQRALQYTPHLILCDIHPEGLSGHEVFDMVQQINSTAIIPFIFLSNKKSYEELRSAMNLGMDDCLVKPFDLKELKRSIEVRLDRQEKILQQVDEKFNILIDNAYVAIYIYQDEKLSYVNQKFCEIFGYSKKELLGMNLINIVYKDDIHLVTKKINRAFKALQNEVEINFRAIRRNQEIIDLKLVGNIVNIQSKKSLVGSVTKSTKSQNTPAYYGNNNLDMTPREKEVLSYICHGYSNSEIGELLKLSARTIEGHRNRLLKKTACKNSVCLAVYAIKQGLIVIE